MKVTVCFGSVRVVVPCGSGDLLVKELVLEATRRYKKATAKDPNSCVVVHHLQTQSGILDPDDRLSDVADDREQIIASFDDANAQGDGSALIDDNVTEENPFSRTKRVSMNFLGDGDGYKWLEAADKLQSPNYSTKSLPRETGKRKEPLGQSMREGEMLIILNEDESPLGFTAIPDREHGGMLVQHVDPGSKAERGRLRRGDRVVDINGNKFVDLSGGNVQDRFRSCLADRELRIRVIRAAMSLSVEANLSDSFTRGGIGRQSISGNKKLRERRLQVTKSEYFGEPIEDTFDVLKKSSSLESLRTMLQEVHVENTTLLLEKEQNDPKQETRTKKASLLRGIGNIFRFGTHRKMELSPDKGITPQSYKHFLPV